MCPCLALQFVYQYVLNVFPSASSTCPGVVYLLKAEVDLLYPRIQPLVILDD